MLAINDEQFIERSEIIWEKGTNRSSFFRGEIDKYGWVDVGSSFLPSEIIAAFLWAQLENIQKIQKKRLDLWNFYDQSINESSSFTKCEISSSSGNNAHLYYITTNNYVDRNKLLDSFKKEKIFAVFHYQSLHKSDFFSKHYKGKELHNADYFSDCLIRLPLFFELTEKQQIRVIEILNDLGR